MSSVRGERPGYAEEGMPYPTRDWESVVEEVFTAEVTPGLNLEG